MLRNFLITIALFLPFICVYAAESKDKALLEQADFASVQRIINQNPESLRETIRMFHKSKEDIGLKFTTLDRLFGIDYKKTEETIQFIKYTGNELSQGPIQNTQTRYHFIQQLFTDHPPRPTDIFYDLGSGYGRVLFYGACLFPAIKFKGVELIKERADATKRVIRNAKFSNVQIINEDILNVDFSDGSYFFLFNPFPDEVMNKVMDKFHILAMKKKITLVILGRTPVKKLVSLPWLTVVKSLGPDMSFVVFESKLSL